MIRAIFARLAGIKPPPVTDNQPVEKRFPPKKDRQALFEQRALRVMNRDPEKAAMMVRHLTILAEGRNAKIRR
jgi:hypothetical protein